MAYWLYCTGCQQWSKSTTPLSDDKTCSFCNKKFANSNTQSEELIIPDAEEIPAEVVTAEMTEELVEIETSAIPEEEISVSNETQEEPDAPVIETVPEADTPDTPDETAMTEVVEIAQETEEPPISELPKAKPAPTKKSVIDKKGRSSKK